MEYEPARTKTPLRSTTAPTARVNRAVRPLPASAPGPLAVTERPLVQRMPLSSRIRPMHDRSGIIRREISEDAWTNQVLPKLDGGATVTVWGKSGAVILRKVDGVLQFKLASGKGDFKPLSAEALGRMKENASLTPGHLTEDPTFNQKVNPGKGFEVTEFSSEPLSMVHHTANTEGEDKNPHLTVENAHVLAAEELLNPASATRDVRDKSGEDKATINDALRDTFGVGSVDNLNFYPAEAPKGGGKGGAKKPSNWKVKEEEQTPHEQLPMSVYLAFLAHALTTGGAAPEYGQKIIAFANKMGEEKRLDPSQLFLRVGMDEPALVRAVLIIDSQLPAGSKLAISAPTRKVFAKWWNLADNEEKVPYLPAPDAKDGDAVVRSGTTYKNESFSQIEVKYCREAFPEFVTAINAFTPKPQVVAQALPKGKGNGKK